MNEEAKITNRTDDARFTLFPIKYRALWNMYKKAQASFWVMEELDLQQDLADWDKLTKNEQHFILNVLAFFSQSDLIVLDSLAVRFMREVTIPEARCFYSFQAAMETIHSEVYSMLINTYVSDPTEQLKLFEAIKHVPCVRKKAMWAVKWIENIDATFSERLIAFAAVEGIFFSSSFCSIYWLSKRGLMPGLSLSNQFIARDEGSHCDFACLMFETIGRPLAPERVQMIIRDAVECEEEFVKDSLPVHLIGMNSSLMIDYVRYTADRLLKQLKVEPIFNVPLPFDWMERISLESRQNFFEGRNSAYRKAGVGQTAQANSISFDAEF